MACMIETTCACGETIWTTPGEVRYERCWLCANVRCVAYEEEIESLRKTVDDLKTDLLMRTTERDNALDVLRASARTEPDWRERRNKLIGLR